MVNHGRVEPPHPAAEIRSGRPTNNSVLTCAIRVGIFPTDRRALERPKMSIVENKNAFVDPTAVAINLSQMFTVTAASNDPAYLVLTVLDRNEYTEAASG